MSAPWQFENAMPANAWPAFPGYAESATLALLLQLDASQWFGPERLEAEQMRQLEGLARHAWNTVPYYRETWAGRFEPAAPWSRERFRALPVLGRRDLQARFENLKSRALPRAHGGASETRTSGSSGTPLRVLNTDITSQLWNAITLRDHAWHRRDLGRKLAVIRRGTAGRTPSWGRATAGLVATGECVVRDIDSDVEAQLDWLEREQPGYLLTYPSLIAELAKAAMRRRVSLPGLLEVRTFGESLGPDTRALCREAWSVPVIDTYSAEEVGYIALQCPQHHHYHVQSEHILVEILDERGEPSLPGETGRVVVTDLHNFALPLLRYDIGDYASFGEPCPCGRGLPVLQAIAGRVNNMLITASGERFWPVFGMRPAQDFVRIRQHQFVQKEFDLVEARLVVDAPLAPEQEERLVRHMQQGLPAGIRVRIIYLDSIPRSRGGKFQDFISELPRA